MSVDVIAGVMGAVNQDQATARFQVATAQSKALQAKQPAFAALMQKMLPLKTNQIADANDGGLYGTADHTVQAPQAKRKADAMVALEGALMTKMVDSMMPKDENSVYGNGIAGETWRSFAVDQMGKTMAKGDLLNFNRKEASATPSQAVNLFGQGFGAPNEMKITPFAGES
ncbi:hypothetical protein [Aestuariivirga litoralis]|uniref:hypothetical protein n=1 Tax=Aestuariivirga litoralis TaxID=2650924 RepID=UPI0018C6DE44|nr:hypothetical protein [Aestuariivirga litoralis]MBG1233171.1 hypothetical protein [Aestuariivirga litoralis]